MRWRILSLVAVVVRLGCLYLPRICIYSFMRLRTYTMYTWSRLGEQLRWCWTICHSSVFIADIHIRIPVCLYIGVHVWLHSEPQFVTNTSVDVYLVEDRACHLCVLPLWATIWDKHACVFVYLWIFWLNTVHVRSLTVSHNLWQTCPYMSQPRPGPRVYTCVYNWSEPSDIFNCRLFW